MVEWRDDVVGSCGHLAGEVMYAVHLWRVRYVAGEEDDVEVPVGGKPFGEMPAPGVSVVDDFEAGEALAEDCVPGQILDVVGDRVTFVAVLDSVSYVGTVLAC